MKYILLLIFISNLTFHQKDSYKSLDINFFKVAGVDSLGQTGPIQSNEGDSIICINVLPEGNGRIFSINSVKNAKEYEWIINDRISSSRVTQDTFIYLTWNNPGNVSIQCIPKNDLFVGDTAKLNLLIKNDCFKVGWSYEAGSIGDTINMKLLFSGAISALPISSFDLKWKIDTSHLDFIDGKQIYQFQNSPKDSFIQNEILNLKWEFRTQGSGLYLPEELILPIFEFRFLIKNKSFWSTAFIDPNPVINNIKINTIDSSINCIVSESGLIGIFPESNCNQISDEPPGCFLCNSFISNFRNDSLNPGTPLPEFDCGTIENNFWISFIPQIEEPEFQIQFNNCNNNEGLEGAIFNSNLEKVSDCLIPILGPSISVGTIRGIDLIPGENYSLMIDGINGDICDINIYGTGIYSSRPPDPPSWIRALPDNPAYCPGPESEVCFGIGKVNNTSKYNWIIPPNSVLSADYGNVICIKFVNEGLSTISVTPDNPCFPGTPSIFPTIVVKIPPTILPIKKVCEDEFPIFIDGIEFKAPGIFDTILISERSCDSLVRYTIETYPPSIKEIEENICTGESYLLPNGLSTDSSGTYQINLPGSAWNGCDSTVIINLTVVPSFETFETLKACEGDVITLSNGLEITQSGTYNVILPSSGTCDSIIFYDAVFHPNFAFRDSIQICEGDNYLWQGQLLENQGNYRVDLNTANGCDSVIRLNLQYHQAPQIIDTLIIPDNGSGNGGIFLQFAGNISNYSFSWNNGASTMNLSDISFGTYTLTVGFGDGCFAKFTFEVDMVSSLEGVLLDQGILVYPNPAEDYLNVYLENNTSNIEKIEVLSASGNLLLHQIIKSKENQIDLHGLAPGNYYLRLFRKEGEVFVWRFVKG